MSLHLHNTLTRELERFKPLKQDEVKVYYCGITPYSYTHIGNLRAYLYEDFVIRTLRFLGYKVKTVMNITDIDDKTIRDSQKSGKSLKEFTEFYTEIFLSDLAKLSIHPADIITPISHVIPEMEMMIQGLIKKDFAYLADDGSVYYRVSKFRKYGELAHLDMKGMISNVRINNDEYDKEQVADFALWKAYDRETDGPNVWNAKFEIDGKEVILPGRPGWHIECSACNMHHFGEQIDIHMGGIDNLFPHHQNEVAQTEAYTGKQFSKYWMHGGHLLVDNKKMSKSAGNFYTLRDIVEMAKCPPVKGGSPIGQGGFIPETIGITPLPPLTGGQEQLIYRGFRLMALQNQYRENFNFTQERLQASINTIKGLDEMMKRLGRYRNELIGDDKIESGMEDMRERTAKGRLKFHEISREFRDNQQAFMQEFIEKLEDDFDTLGAMTIVFEYQTYINSGIDDELFSLEECKSMIDFMKTWNEVIAIFDFDLLESTEIVPNEIIALLAERNEAKINKNYTESDRIRNELDTLGYKIIDEKNGARVERK